MSPVAAQIVKQEPKKKKKIQSISQELKIFDFQAIVVATSNFSIINKLGEGGFGSVYKVKLCDYF